MHGISQYSVSITAHGLDWVMISRSLTWPLCRTRLKESIVAVLQVSGKSSDLQLDAKPAVLLIVGVNGGGKTTTIGKLAHKFGSEGAKACHATLLPRPSPNMYHGNCQLPT